MRQPNRSLPGSSRPVEVLCPNVYNRPALDVRSIIPLSISLSNLRNMVHNLHQLRQAMCEDGGLEQLIDIMSSVKRHDDPEEAQVRKAAFQCLSPFGVRGPESIRVRAVEADILPPLVTMIEIFYRAMEPEIREATELGLLPAPPRNTTPARPMQMVTRRRAVTLGSASAPAEGLGGLQIRFNPPTRSPLSRVQAVGPFTPDNASLNRRSMPQDNGAADSSDRMDVDTPTSQDGDDEGVAEDPITDAEALRSPPPEVDTSYSQYVADQPRNPATEAPVLSPRAQVQSMEIDEAHDIPAPSTSTASEQQQPSNSPSPTTLLPPSSPNPVSEHQHQPLVAPNAPLIPYAVPLTRTPIPSHFPRIPHRRITSLHLLPSAEWRIPRSDELIECLEMLAYLSKYPKVRPYFTNTRFIPELLAPWGRPDDATKSVNVFEIVEKFTFTKYHTDVVCFWASIVMRHYSRKDDLVIRRQCAYLQCGKWEPDDPSMRFICCSKCKYPPFLDEANLDGRGIVIKLVILGRGLDIVIGVWIIKRLEIIGKKFGMNILQLENNNNTKIVTLKMQEIRLLRILCGLRGTNRDDFVNTVRTRSYGCIGLIKQ